MDILNYISFLRDIFEYGQNDMEAKYFFVHGGCFQFANKLKEYFPEGEIAVTRELLHVVFYYKDKYYDVDGEYTSKDVIAQGNEIAPAVFKFISSYDCDMITGKAKRNYLDVYRNFSFDEQDEFADFCITHSCIGTLCEVQDAVS